MKYINTIMDEELVLEEVMDFLTETVPCWTGYEGTEAGRLFEVFQDEILKDRNTEVIAVDILLMPERGIIAFNSKCNLYIKYSLYLPITGNGKYREAIYICDGDDAEYNWKPVVVIVNNDDDNSKYFHPNLKALDNPIEDECLENRIIDAYQKF